MALARGPGLIPNITGALSLHVDVRVPATQELISLDVNGKAQSSVGPVSFDVGHAVCLVEAPDGVQEYQLASSYQTTVDGFLGFQINDISTGSNTPLVATGRGSIITPLVQDGVALTPNMSVYLSIVSGMVSQDVPSLIANESTAYFRVGFAINDTQIVLAPETYMRS